jgi:hypothetical protein
VFEKSHRLGPHLESDRWLRAPCGSSSFKFVIDAADVSGSVLPCLACVLQYRRNVGSQEASIVDQPYFDLELLVAEMGSGVDRISLHLALQGTQLRRVAVRNRREAALALSYDLRMAQGCFAVLDLSVFGIAELRAAISLNMDGDTPFPIRRFGIAMPDRVTMAR